MKTILTILHRLLAAVVIAAAVNVAFLLAHGGTYDFRLGFLHLVAHGAFKPLLILNGAFLLAVLTGTPQAPEPERRDHAAAPLLLAALAAVALSFSCLVNPLYDEWNYRGLSATYPSLAGVAHLFFSSQIGVWYRPWGFVSLWLDHALFHDHVWAYHLQNLLLHFGNAFLATLLARRLGLTQFAARWAGVLFLTAAITYEPVMWPSARFDLWAMLLTLLALLASARYLTGEGGKALAAALSCYALAVCSKESGYAFPLLLALMALTWPLERKPADSRRRLLTLGAGVAIVSLGMLAIRKVVLGGAGGYPGTATTPSIHLSFSLATIRIVLARAMQMSLLSVNLSYPMPTVMLAAITGFAAVLAVAVIAGASVTCRRAVLVIYVFAATLPVAPLVSWLDFHAQHVRYLYMPAAFVMMLAAAGLSNARRASTLLFAFGALNLGCGIYNTWIYRTTYENSTMLARRIADDVGAADVGADGSGQPLTVTIVGMPAEYNGVLFSQFELQYRLQEMLPRVKIAFEDHGGCSGPRCYVWEPEERSLARP